MCREREYFPRIASDFDSVSRWFWTNDKTVDNNIDFTSNLGYISKFSENSGGVTSQGVIWKLVEH